tara:strand:+ start:347 stop:988 length:642 start_codon:yes stop_codon:yes gene_type:complete
MQVEFSKVVSGFIHLVLAVGLASQLSLANASAFDIKASAAANLSASSISATSINSETEPAIAAESLYNFPSGATQSVLKSTDDNEITIKLDNPARKNLISQNAIIASQDSSSAQQAGLFRIYRSNLLKKTYQHVIYPGSAIDRDQQGDVILKLTISRKGEIQNVDYDKRADFNSLNKAAARAVKNAMPYPPAPKQLHGETFEVIMPIKFRLAQ